MSSKNAMQEGSRSNGQLHGELLPRSDSKPPSPYKRRYALTKLSGVRAELASVYREMRRGDVPTEVGSRLAYVLLQVAKVLEASDLEKRLDALEAANGK